MAYIHTKIPDRGAWLIYTPKYVKRRPVKEKRPAVKGVKIGPTLKESSLASIKVNYWKIAANRDVKVPSPDIVNHLFYFYHLKDLVPAACPMSRIVL